MRLSVSLLLAAFVALSGCDATAPSEPAASSSAEIIAAHAAAASSSSCAAPSIAFGTPTSGGLNTVVATAATGSDVSASFEEKTNIYNETWEPVYGASYSSSSVTYVTEWGPAHPRGGYYASYRARTLCANGFTSGYSNTITGWVAP